eukprot:178736-Prymnesium_polylepis.1
MLATGALSCGEDLEEDAVVVARVHRLFVPIRSCSSRRRTVTMQSAPVCDDGRGGARLISR